MSLSRDEVELLARRRMLTNLLDEFMAAVAAENPRLRRQLDEIMQEYLIQAGERCGPIDDPERALECIMDAKQEHEPRILDKLDQIVG